MKLLLFIFAVFSASGYVRAQENKDNNFAPKPFTFNRELPTYNSAEASNLAGESRENLNYAKVSFLKSKPRKSLFDSAEVEQFVKEKRINKPDKEKDPSVKDSSESKESEGQEKERFHWKPALIQSGIFLGIQHGFRVLRQQYTRDGLKGPFFRDWAKSVKSLRGWSDGNNFFINYIAHPLQGGLTGRIFVNNSDRAKKQEFGKSKKYWESRAKALAWSAFWSTQFELGPISEANIGNVGLNVKPGYSSMAYVDLVITPVVGTGVLIGEDAIDKYILKNWVEKNARKTTVKIRILRSILTPTTSIANMLRGKVPWKRDNRSL